MAELKVLPPGLMEFVLLLQEHTMELVSVVQKSRDAFSDYRLHAKDLLTDDRAAALLTECNTALLHTKAFVRNAGEIVTANEKVLEEWGFEPVVKKCS